MQNTMNKKNTITSEDIKHMQEDIAHIKIEDSLLQHCVQCIDTIRSYNIPISTRATTSLVKSAITWSYMQ